MLFLSLCAIGREYIGDLWHRYLYRGRPSGDDLDVIHRSRFPSPLALHQVLQGGRGEDLVSCLLDLLPDLPQDAGAGQVAVALVGYTTDRRGRALQGSDNLIELDLRWGFGQRVATLRSPGTPDESGLDQGGQQLIEIRFGDVLACGNLLAGHQPLAIAPRQFEHGPQAIVSLGRNLHSLAVIVQ